MAYRFKLGHSLGQQLSRVVGEQVDRVEKIQSTRHRSLGDRVHAARTATKRIRAVLRFVRVRQPKIWRKENACVRNAARQLAPLREAAVMPAIVTRLRKQSRLAEAGDLAVLLCRTKADSSRVLSNRTCNTRILDQCMRAMRDAADRIDKLKTHLQRGDFITGFRRSYRSARRAWRRLDPHSNAARYHELRKRAKTYAYHCRLFRKAWPKMMRAQQSALAELDDQLGEEHDLAVLAAWLVRHKDEFGENSERSWGRLIAKRQKKLRGEVLLLGQKLFAEKPRVVAGRISVWWATVRKKKCSAEQSTPDARRRRGWR